MKDLVAVNNTIIPVITGATGSGKSAAAYVLARSGLDCEIINADAFQVYKGLDIGTAKPPKEQQSELRHHLIDIIPTDGAYTTGDFVEHAEKAIGEVLARGKTPILVGGTGLYIQSLRDGMFDTPDADESYRDELRLRAEKDGTIVLHKELEAVDFDAAARIHPNDLVRIIRGLEVWKATGVPISVAHKRFHKLPAYKYNIFVVFKEREALYSHINRRVKDMIDTGWQNEVAELMAAGYSPELPSFRAIGYREIADTVTGVKNITEAREIISQKTRNYAKRQMTWFRGMDNVHMLPVEEIIRRVKENYGIA